MARSNVYSFMDVDSVGIATEHSVVSVRIYHDADTYTEIIIKADAAHVGCMGLDVDRQFHAKEEPDWVDLEQQNGR